MKKIYRSIPQFILLVIISLALPGLTTIAAEEVQTDTDYAQVEKVRMVYRGSRGWDVHVSVRHNDQGWEHYADRWQILDDSTGEIIAERILAHPHDTEQPFTRSLSSQAIAADVRLIRIRSSCPNHGFGGQEIVVEIPSGDLKDGYTINQ